MVLAFVLNLSILLWNAIGIFGINYVLVDNKNTLTGLLASVSCGGVATSLGTSGITNCETTMIIIVAVTSALTLGSGVATLMAFGNTYLAFSMFLTIIPSLLVLYDTITAILDQFITSWLATDIGGFFAVIFSLLIVFTTIQIQAKVPIGT